MTYLIGTDEAGYGPNLGPLVVSATVWRVPDGQEEHDLYELLADAIAPTSGEARNGRVAMADSKALYTPGKGLRHLERGLLAALGVLKRPANCWSEIWAALDSNNKDERDAIPWYAGVDFPLPLDATAEEVKTCRISLDKTLATAGVELIEVQSRAVFPERFNRMVDSCGSKGLALSRVTLGLLADVMRPLGEEPIRVRCDKHGGRNRYADLLAEQFDDWLIEIHGESRPESTYRFGPTERRVEVAFQAKAESTLPAALASMASKYLRELAMRAFNAFWHERIPGLRPTAGYPQDARRFRDEITAVVGELEIADNVLWRMK
ncbi:MAG: hypothetical protein JW818_07635 [Pirellulales bacterium]|nr:hypothetical protein [Pirellulales bacterium]